MKKRKNIVILGAGFAGLQVAQGLSKKLKSSLYSIILIDRRYVHIYTPDLYEIAAAFNDKITNECLTNLTDLVATPLKALLDPKKINFIQDEIKGIDVKSQKILLNKHQPIGYEYLVVALGSEINYFDIPGLEKNSFCVKTITDSLKLNCHLDMFFQEKWKRKISNEKVKIVVGGGGATGVEVAGELTNYMDRLSEKYHYDRSKIEVKLVEGNSKLVGMDQKGTEAILRRFKDLGIKTHLNSRITALTKKEVSVLAKNGEKVDMGCDVMVWTGGVQVNKLIRESLGEDEKKGAIPVDIYLRSLKYDNVFAAGDNAYFVEPGSEQRVPMLAQIAFDQGKVIANNLISVIKGKKKNLKSFKPRGEAIIVPIGGKFAVCRVGRFMWSGFLAWALRKLVTLKYSLSIMPSWLALKKWWHSHSVFVRND